MQDSEAKTQEKPNPFRMFWPDVKTEKGMKDAIKAGTWALGCLILSYVVLIAMMLFRNADTMGVFTDETEFAVTLVINLIAIPLAGLLAWFVFKKQSLIAAAIGLAWIAVEVAMKLSLAGSRGAVIAVLVLLYSINGLRGTLAARKVRQASSA